MSARGHGHALAEATRSAGWGPYPFPGGVLVHNYRAFKDDASVELLPDKLVHVHILRPEYCTGPGKVLHVCECAAMESTVAWLGGLAFDAFPEGGERPITASAARPVVAFTSRAVFRSCAPLHPRAPQTSSATSNRAPTPSPPTSSWTRPNTQ